MLETLASRPQDSRSQIRRGHGIFNDIVGPNPLYYQEDLPTIPFSYRENKRKAFLKFLGGRRLTAPLKFNLYLSF